MFEHGEVNLATSFQVFSIARAAAALRCVPTRARPSSPPCRPRITRVSRKNPTRAGAQWQQRQRQPIIIVDAKQKNRREFSTPPSR